MKKEELENWEKVKEALEEVYGEGNIEIIS